MVPSFRPREFVDMHVYVPTSFNENFLIVNVKTVWYEAFSSVVVLKFTLYCKRRRRMKFWNWKLENDGNKLSCQINVKWLLQFHNKWMFREQRMIINCLSWQPSKQTRRICMLCYILGTTHRLNYRNDFEGFDT